MTLLYCVDCKRVLCEACGGIAGEVPLPAFRCAWCRLREYELAGALLPLDGPAGRAREVAMLSLIRGRMLLISQEKRHASKVQNRRGRAAFKAFAEEMHLRLLPLHPGLIMDAAVFDLTGKDLDSTTINLRVNAMWDLYNYAKIHLGVAGLKNPCRDVEVLVFSKVLRGNYKKRSKAREPVTILICAVMMRWGWDVRRPLGKWGRLRWTFLNLGMLRAGATNALIIMYSITRAQNGDLIIIYEEGSDIHVLPSDDGHLYIEVNVDSDKNVNSLNRRKAYIPDFVEALDVHPVEMLQDYLLAAQPPSGGRLFAKPHRSKAGVFSKPGNASYDIKRAYTRSCQLAGEPVDDKVLSLLGTHSGRKSLAQWLWNDGVCRRIIADAGGWFLKRDAVDLYFRTARETILNAVRNVGAAFRRSIMG